MSRKCRMSVENWLQNELVVHGNSLFRKQTKNDVVFAPKRSRLCFRAKTFCNK